MITITRAHTAEHYRTMEALGRVIVPEVYVPYFPREWADYLVESSHTAIALAAQATQGYRHYRVEVDEVLAGYFALHERGDGIMVLSHLYLRPDFRGKGLGQQVMEFVHREAVELRVAGIELLVLRKNIGVVNFYQRNGYAIAKEVLTPIGPGAELEDYLMRKEMAACQEDGRGGHEGSAGHGI
jgi:GNAT superfamily N-acetyltransferase